MDLLNNIYEQSQIAFNLNVVIQEPKFTIKRIDSSINRSYLMFDQTDICIYLGKINHLTMRGCHRCTVYIEGSISGVDMLFCTDVRLVCVNISSFDIWCCSIVNIKVQSAQRFVAKSCYTVFLNDVDLHCSPFKSVNLVN